MAKVKYCLYCGKPLTSGCRKYCKICKPKVKKERDARYRANKRLKAKKSECGQSCLSLGQVSKLMKQYGYGNDYARFVHDYHEKIKGV